VDGALPVALAADDDAPVPELDAIRRLVDLLAALAAAPDETLLDRREIDPEALDPGLHVLYFRGRDAKVPGKLHDAKYTDTEAPSSTPGDIL